MRRMAEALNTSVGALEDELMQLILDGQIQARIDSHNKVDIGHSHRIVIRDHVGKGCAGLLICFTGGSFENLAKY